ncbi:MogA/MoaB family molybdenum cofactor biosynthesis protein [Jeotgalibacillus haloalkalitolerans]|uniref:Molybdenum cofactor biosynthesis protein B n=1 Tax=Jeotgalibacillus haloalkalitolerans TaxID=3104292 RepID=A0ABU5KPW8_9BACL|nr:molybdenum cofactor biosynthesis protein B [Jeotgalibacillus sp. HH7-29]MDZ5713300.1 molybdenum cofactor biosynthesis protein B [Jeotgalibacillus sp. HH7-29]
MHEEHKKQAPRTVACKVITVSDTRTEETDKSGRQMKEMLQASGHEVAAYEIVTDEIILIQQAVKAGLMDDGIQAVLINGGTGLAARDVTIEAVTPLFEKEIPGFGELFRFLSYTEDIGSAAMMSRAVAGVASKTAVFSTPGSTGAVKLAMEKLILPELGHVIRELNKDQ